jgi:tripartite-type tricarboxylate transporter receptor subunit TctC
VVIENRPGGDGMVAIQAFLSANDDHTFLFAPSGNFTVHPYQYDKLPYAPEDLVPIARVSNTIIAVGVPASMNVITMVDWVAPAQARPGKFNATAVPGFTEFVFDYFVKTAGLDLQKIPYRDTVQAATDLGENRVQIYMSSYAIIYIDTFSKCRSRWSQAPATNFIKLVKRIGRHCGLFRPPRSVGKIPCSHDP